LAVVDIGSNSVRLVAFERLSRAPIPIYNEKVLCGLGRGLGDSGKLNPAGVGLAIKTIRRFMTLVRAMRADAEIVATAAVRDSSNGREFVRTLERECRARVRVIGGAEEAIFSARGVISAIPTADGVMGDLGGGSLELVEIGGRRTGAHATLPLGPLRHLDRPRRAPKTIDEIDSALRSLPWLQKLAGRSFFAVGGAWRTFARVHMSQMDYPLKVIHQYTALRRQIADLAALLSSLSDGSLEKLEGVSKRRVEALPFAALVLERIIRIANPSRVVFCAYGLREGLLFSRLRPAERRRDPFLAAAEELGRLGARFDFFPDELRRWMAPLFADASPQEVRLRRGIVLLSDIAWRTHPDYRAETAFVRILHAPFVGLDHGERVLAALAVCARYRGEQLPAVRSLAERLLDEDQRIKALQLGRALNLAFALSGGVPGLLKHAKVTRERNRLVLRLAKRHDELGGDLVFRCLKRLAESFALDPKMVW
jgi:exopolyphosphatase/guanosine-5'-triphosphate,3'-diphosphate pyrophosphatase